MYKKDNACKSFFGNLNLLLCFTVLVAVAVAKWSSSNDDGDENGKKAMG